MEMPGLWKAWKAKRRLPPLSTSPLEISPKAGEIPTFHSSGDEADGKVENQEQVFHFPTATNPLSRKAKNTVGWAGLRPRPEAALHAA